jgi:hypothetical protein
VPFSPFRSFLLPLAAVVVVVVVQVLCFHSYGYPRLSCSRTPSPVRFCAAVWWWWCRLWFTLALSLFLSPYLLNILFYTPSHSCLLTRSHLHSDYTPPITSHFRFMHACGRVWWVVGCCGRGGRRAPAAAYLPLGCGNRSALPLACVTALYRYVTLAPIIPDIHQTG